MAPRNTATSFDKDIKTVVALADDSTIGTRGWGKAALDALVSGADLGCGILLTSRLTSQVKVVGSHPNASQSAWNDALHPMRLALCALWNRNDKWAFPQKDLCRALGLPPVTSKAAVFFSSRDVEEADIMGDNAAEDQDSLLDAAHTRWDDVEAQQTAWMEEARSSAPKVRCPCSDLLNRTLILSSARS